MCIFDQKVINKCVILIVHFYSLKSLYYYNTSV